MNKKNDQIKSIFLHVEDRAIGFIRLTSIIASIGFVVILSVLFFMGALGSPFTSPKTYSYDFEVRIVEIDAARQCYRLVNSRRDKFIHRLYTRPLGAQRRSQEPKKKASGYCGTIYTDQGNFDLPWSRYPLTFLSQREDFYDMLKNGCQYQLTVGAQENRRIDVSSKPEKLNAYFIASKLTDLNDCHGSE